MLLLDTWALVWMAVEPARLSRPARQAIERASKDGGLAIASIGVWELAQMFARGRLRAPGTVESAVRLVLDRTGVGVRELSPAIAALAAEPGSALPGDPVSRIVCATAIAEGLPLVTSDPALSSCPRMRTIW